LKIETGIDKCYAGEHKFIKNKTRSHVLLAEFMNHKFKKNCNLAFLILWRVVHV
jgi:hypothetical protein